MHNTWHTTTFSASSFCACFCVWKRNPTFIFNLVTSSCTGWLTVMQRCERKNLFNVWLKSNWEIFAKLVAVSGFDIIGGVLRCFESYSLTIWYFSNFCITARFPDSVIRLSNESLCLMDVMHCMSLMLVAHT